MSRLSSNYRSLSSTSSSLLNRASDTHKHTHIRIYGYHKTIRMPMWDVEPNDKLIPRGHKFTRQLAIA